MRTQLINKINNIQIDNLPKGIKKNPYAKYYNYVSGNNKDGSYEIYSFYNNFNKLIKRISNYYFNNGENEKYITKYRGRFQKTIKLINNKVESITKKEFVWRKLNKYLLIENTNSRNSSQENIKIRCLEPKEKEKRINIKTSWDGRMPEIDYLNMDKIFENEQGVEYLQVFADRKAFKRYEHIAKYQILEQNLEGIANSFNVITTEKIPKLADRMGELHKAVGVTGAFDQNTGDIYYVIYNMTFPNEEIDVIAHEIQHAKDFSDCLRLDDSVYTDKNRIFYERARKNGIITEENSPIKYQELKKMRDAFNDERYYDDCIQGKHDKLGPEASAIKKGEAESKKATVLWEKMMKYFGFWQ